MEIHESLAWLLVVAGGMCAIYWAIVFGRIQRTKRRVLHVREGSEVPAPSGGWPTVSIVVPVHNEERVIDRCLKGLRGQDHPDLQLIIVLDRCTDGTAAIVAKHAAEDDRIIPITNDDCPPEWAGKCNAARVGANRATGEWILFVDADVRLDRALVRSAQAIALRDSVAMLSLIGDLTIGHWFEKLLQPMASMTLLRMFPLERVSHASRPRAFANGQFMLFRRGDYDAIGGHHAVRDDLLEDLAFARAIQHGGRRLAMLFADKMMEVSMYDSIGAFRRGWRRIFIESCVRNVRRLRQNALRIGSSGTWPSITAILAIVWFAFDRNATPAVTVAAIAAVVGIAVQCAALSLIYRRMNVPTPWIAGYPIASLIIAWECLQGASDLAHRRPIRWGGREYVLTPR